MGTRVCLPVSLIHIVSGQKEKYTPLTSMERVFAEKNEKVASCYSGSLQNDRPSS